MKAVRLPVPEALDGFGFTAAPSAGERLIPGPVRCDPIGRRENVLPVAGGGTAEARPDTALAMGACARGERVRIFRVSRRATPLPGVT